MFRSCFQHLAGIERRRIPATPAGDMRLHRLERPEPWSPLLIEALNTAAKWDEVQQYPDYAPFYARLSRFIGVPANRIVVGAGIEEFIRCLVMLCCDPGEKVAFTYPTCAMFDIYARVFGARAMHIDVDPVAPLSAIDIGGKLYLDTRLVILPSPGQPVDTCYPIEDLRLLARHCDIIGAILVVDEAYHGFGAPTAIPLIDEFDNVVVLRTFSKAFGAASLRVGFAVAGEKITRALDAVRASGEISGPSLRAATVLMDRWEDEVLPGISEVIAGRDSLRRTLERDGYRVRGTNANHVLIDMGSPDKARATAAWLHQAGVHVRVNVAPCDAWLMVTSGGRELMGRFYEAFRNATREAKAA